MKFTIDTEFNGIGGELLSMALVPFDPEEPPLYLRVPRDHDIHLDPWVRENVWPHLDAHGGQAAHIVGVKAWGRLIANYLDGWGSVPYIIADWPSDIAYFCDAIITGPGEMAAIPRVQFDIVRVDPYEAGSAPANAVRHNAYWDAVALRDHLVKHS